MLSRGRKRMSSVAEDRLRDQLDFGTLDLGVVQHEPGHAPDDSGTSTFSFRVDVAYVALTKSPSFGLFTFSSFS